MIITQTFTGIDCFYRNADQTLSICRHAIANAFSKDEFSEVIPNRVRISVSNKRVHKKGWLKVKINWSGIMNDVCCMYILGVRFITLDKLNQYLIKNGILHAGETTPFWVRFEACV
jgi:hypothetical protein